MSKTPISILQELMVQRKKSHPDYIMENSSEINMPGASFKCTVKFADNLCACGYGSNKKEAKQDSAKKALELIGFTNEIQYQMSFLSISNRQPIKTNLSTKNSPFVNYVGKLNEYASTNGKLYPTYADDTVIETGEFITHCNFLNLITDGYGLKKKDAKQDAAKRMLERLRTENLSTLSTACNVSELHVEKLETIDNLSKEVLKKYENISAITQTYSSEGIEIKPIHMLRDVVTTLEDLEGELHKHGYTYTIKTFQKDPYIMMLKLDNSYATIMGKGKNKEQALDDLYETAFYMFSKGFTV